MSLFTKLANAIFSPVDASGAPRPVQNIDVQVWGSEVERILAAYQAGGGIIFPDLETANASLAYAQNQMAWVIGDPVPANNGVYRKIGASGSGSWARMGDLPFSMIPFSNAGAGTADAIIAEPMLPLPTTPGAALLTVNILAANTGSVTLNGKPLRTNSGNEIAPGGLTAGSIHAFLDMGDHFRLLSDQASGAIVAAAEAAQAAAESAAGANLSSADSRAAAILTNFPGAVHYIRTAGYAVAGDGGGALYKRAVTEPDHPGKFQSADGAWWELAEDVQRPASYGAVPADIASASANASALRFAFDRAIEDGQAVIEIPAKDWYLDSKVTKTLANGGVTLMGKGRSTTRLIWNQADGGLDLTYPEGGWWHNNPGAALNIEGLSLCTTILGGGTALKINGRTVEGRPQSGTSFRNFGWNGTSASAYWTLGCDLLDVSQTMFTEVWGVGSVSNSTLGTHVRIRSSAADTDAVEHVFTNFHLTYGNRGIDAADHVEGIMISGAVIIGVNYGIYWDCAATYESQLTIGQSHISARNRCILTRRVLDSQIGAGNLLFITTSEGVGIELIESGRTVIETQVILGPATGGTGIAIRDDLGNLAAVPTLIKRQILSRMQTGIWLQATAKNVVVEPPLTALVGTPVLDSGTGNTVLVNQPREHRATVVFNLTGGAIEEFIDIPVPAGVFSAKPTFATLSGQPHNPAFIAEYDYSNAATTATNLRFRLTMNGGGVVPVGNKRFFVLAVA